MELFITLYNLICYHLFPVFSLDEMEALCKRIAIMSGGELGALGSPAALRADHAAGHAVRLKLHAANDGRRAPPFFLMCTV